MTLFTLGGLAAVPASTRTDLLAPSTRASLEAPELLDAPCRSIPGVPRRRAIFGLSMDTLANCVISAENGADQRIAACLVLATGRADVNNVVKRSLDVRKASFLHWNAPGAQRHGVRRYHPHRAPQGLADPIDRRVVDTEIDHRLWRVGAPRSCSPAGSCPASQEPVSPTISASVPTTSAFLVEAHRSLGHGPPGAPRGSSGRFAPRVLPPYLAVSNNAVALAAPSSSAPTTRQFLLPRQSPAPARRRRDESGPTDQ